MKTLLTLFIFITLSNSSFAEIAKFEIINSTEEVSFEKMITTLYNQEIQKEDSLLRKKIIAALTSGYMNEDEFVFITDDNFGSVSEEDRYDEKVHIGEIVNTGSGKSGAAFYGADYIVPIQVSSPGSGLITTTELFIKVSAYQSYYDHSTGLNEDKTGVIFESLAVLKAL